MRWQCQLARSLDSAKGVPLHAVQHSRHRAAGRGGVIVIENSANFNFSAAPMSVVVKSVSKIGAPGSSRKRDKSGGARTDEQFVQRYSRGDKSVKRSFSGPRPQIGDLIKFHRRFYSHYAIYLGVDEKGHEVVGHIWDDQTAPDRADTSIDARVIITPLQKVPGTYEVGNSDYDSRLVPLHPRKIVERVRQRVGERGYNLVLNNCEHFATWARYGERCSAQVDRWTVPLSALIGLEVALHMGVDTARIGLASLVAFGFTTLSAHSTWWAPRHNRPPS